MDFPLDRGHIDAQISAMKTTQQIEFKQCHDDDSLFSAMEEALFDKDVCDDERIGALCYVYVVLQARITGGLT